MYPINEIIWIAIFHVSFHLVITTGVRLLIKEYDMNVTQWFTNEIPKIEQPMNN
jgi:hypothetical protein